MKYSDTSLWKTAFATSGDQNKEVVDHLISEYESMRNKVSHLLGKIRKDFPNLTLHDISHADRLWELASEIAGPCYSISCYEGFVLGGAILLHDAALSFDSFGGKEVLRSTTIWKDYLARQTQGAEPEDESLRDADFYAIRQLHAQRAGQLPTDEYTNDEGIKDYIISDEYIRLRLGPLIGKVASSHHWSIEDVSLKLDSCFAYESSLINSQKLACLLRCADAAHIDDSRAPDHLLKVLNVNKVSMSHWHAQNHLAPIVYNPDEDGMLMLKSTIQYKEADFDAWNVAYDAACVLDNEIKQCNRLLRDLRFKASGVSGAGSRESFSQFVKTDGWVPCECKIHVSKVADMISSLGGNNLYGEEDRLKVVIRELIQNARDAICARRNLEQGSDFQGEIVVSMDKIDNDYYLSVKDNGVGMSRTTLTTSFLDFGTSFWSTNDAIEEFPGLMSADFHPVGHYGIGFFSSFMVAKKAEVNSRKYDLGVDSNISICFPKGLSLTPIVRQKKGESMHYSTEVKLLLRKQPNSFKVDDIKVPFTTYVASIVPGLDVNVYASYRGNKELAHQNITEANFDKKKWLSDLLCINARKDAALKRYVNKYYKYLRFVYSQDRIVGLATLFLPYIDYQSKDYCINPFSYMTIGGLCANNQQRSPYSYVGYIDYYPKSLSRDAGKSTCATSDDLHLWAKSQMDLILRSPNHEDFIHLYLPQILGQHHILNPLISNCEVRKPAASEMSQLSVQEAYEYFAAGGCMIAEKASIKSRKNSNTDFMQFLNQRQILILGDTKTFYGKYHIDAYSSFSFLQMVRNIAEKNNYKLYSRYTRNTILPDGLKLVFPVCFFSFEKQESSSF